MLHDARDALIARIQNDLNGDYITTERYRYRLTVIEWDGELLVKLQDPDTLEVEQFGKIVLT